MSNKEIANRYGVAEQTVKNQIHLMMRKLGAQSRVDIARCIIEHDKMNENNQTS
jgi:DNA-binding NarL/FixJ family response regulator